MKKAFALFFAIGSGLYLLTIGIAPDPLPIVDEAAALMILVKSMDVLGFDIRRFIPFMKRRKPRPAEARQGPVIDV